MIFAKYRIMQKSKASAINLIWLLMVLVAIVTAAYTGKMAEVTQASFESAKNAVILAIGLIGAMAFWLGIMKVAEASGLMYAVARLIRPIMVRLFPDVPANHPAMSAMIMNMAANSLGLGNAATPMGIKAMTELDKLNPVKGQATNAMCLFLAINTSSVTLLPLGVITVRASAGAQNPAAILLPGLFATLCSTFVAILAAKLLAKRNEKIIAEPSEDNQEDHLKEEISAKDLVHVPWWSKLIVLGLVLAFFIGMGKYFLGPSTYQGEGFLNHVSHLSSWLISILIMGFLSIGFLKGVKVYETLTEGAKEGFEVATRIIPFLVAIFVAIGMLRASGAVELFVNWIAPVTNLVGMPGEALTVAFLRPLSGSGSFAAMSEIVAKDPDSFLSFVVSTMQGSTETTFYVLAVYFGSISITKSRHALPAALLADFTGVLAALFFSHLFY